jgi:hypothetical protein
LLSKYKDLNIFHYPKFIHNIHALPITPPNNRKAASPFALAIGCILARIARGPNVEPWNSLARTKLPADADSIARTPDAAIYAKVYMKLLSPVQRALHT